MLPAYLVRDDAQALQVLVLILAMVVTPKLLGYGLIAFDKRARAAFGGLGAVTAGVALEMAISIFAVYVRMAVRVMAFVDVVVGHDSGWPPSERDDRSMPATTYFRFHLTHTLFGIAVAAASFAISLALFVWLLPAILGLVMSGPLSALLARQDVRENASADRLLSIPEELSVPSIIADTEFREQMLGRRSGANAAGPLRDRSSDDASVHRSSY
jgi:membrane glycosyltransferase